MSSVSVTRNAVMAVVQVVVSGSILFILYRHLLNTIGPEEVGIWSIILATISASRISELGLTASAVKFVAQYLARGETGKACDVITTTAVTIGGVLAVVLTSSYPVIIWLLPEFIPASHLHAAAGILPCALFSVWSGAVAGVYLSGLEGCQRVDLRVWVSMLSQILFFVGAWLLVVRHGLMGLAWAQIGQSAAMLAGGRLFLGRVLPEYRKSRFWKYQIFREMLHYGANFQITSIFAMLVEPVTKALMAKFGGLSQAAYYEMSSRMVLQFRSLLVAANRVVVPRIADLHEKRPEAVREKYLESYRVILFLSLPLYTVIVVSAPLIGRFWIGHYESSFVVYSTLIAGANLVNTLIGPAYFVYLGTGVLRWNIIAHMVICVFNGVFGYALGSVWGGNGVVWGTAIAVSVGSSLVAYGYHRDQRIPFGELLPRESRKLSVACCIVLLLGLVFFYQDRYPATMMTRSGLCLLLSMAVIPALWAHPVRIMLLSRIFSETDNMQRNDSR